MPCTQVYDKAKGGLKKLEEEVISRLNASVSDQERYAKLHHSSQFGMEPLIPFHYVQWDPMHGLHNELNVLMDEVCVYLYALLLLCLHVYVLLNYTCMYSTSLCDC